MLLIPLLSLVSFSLGMHIPRQGLDAKTVKAIDDYLELGPRLVSLSMIPDEFFDNVNDDQNDDDNNEDDNYDDRISMISKRGVDPMSLPRLIKEPPLKKRSDFESRKRGGVVYPSAAKQTVPLVRVREPPLKRGQMFLEELLQLDTANKRFLNPVRRIRYGSSRRILS